MRASDRTITVMALTALACAAGVIVISSPMLRLPLGLLLVLYLPGAAILRAAFRTAPRGLTALVFAAGLSITATVFCGFALHILGAMTRGGWAMALGAVTLAACGAAHLKPRTRRSKIRNYAWPRLRPAQAAMILGAAGLTVTAVVIEHHQVLARTEFAYTEFWMVPDWDRGLVTLGVKNVEAAPTTYDVEVTVDGNLARVWRNLPLAVGETWRAELALPAPSAGSKGAEAWLFKGGDHSLVYRRVWLRRPAEN